MLRNTNVVGAVTESMIVSFLSSKGYEVYLPFQPHTRADLIYIDDERPKRVQIKTANIIERDGSIFEQARLVRNNNETLYTPEEIDEFWIAGTHLWRIPIHDVLGLKQVSLLCLAKRPRKTVRSYDPNDWIVVKGTLDRRFRDRVVFDDPEGPLSITKTEYSDSISKLIAGRERNQQRERPYGPKPK